MIGRMLPLAMLASLCLIVAVGYPDIELAPEPAGVAVRAWDKRHKEIVEAAKLLPPRFRRQSVMAMSVPRKELKAACKAYGRPYDGKGWRVTGLYVMREGLGPFILLDDTLKKEEFRFVCLHELGHFIYFEVLTEAERTAYAAVWRELGRHPTEYGSTQPAEGFAEALALWVLKSPDQNPDEREFIVSLLK